MKIAVITLGTKNISEYSRYSFDINKAYCEKHGYTYIQYNDIIDSSRPPAWSKILAIKNHIDAFDWLMWIDADAIFYNHDIRIEERIDEQFNLIISKGCGDTWGDVNIPDNANLNTGVFLIRGKVKWSVDLLNNIYGRTNRLNHRWWENQAFSDIYLENKLEINGKIKVVDQHLLNGYENTLYGYFDFHHEQYTLHWAGMNEEDRKHMAKIRHSEFVQSKFSGEKKKNRVIINVF